MMDEHLQPKKLQEEAAEGYWHPKVWEPLCFVKGPRGFPGGSDSKESTCDVGNLCLIPGSGRFPQRREWQPTPFGNALSCPGNHKGLSRAREMV